MSRNNFVLVSMIAERFHEALEKGLPDMTSRKKADTAMIVINTLAKLPMHELAMFTNIMVDYMSLDPQSKIEVLSHLSTKITEVKIG